MEYEKALGRNIRTSLRGQYAMGVIGERVLLVDAAREALAKDPEDAARKFSPFILSIARAPEAEWLYDCFIAATGSVDGQLVMIPRRSQAPSAPPALTKKEDGR